MHIDDPLVTRAIQGDLAALSELLMRHGPVVRNWLRGGVPRKFQSLIGLDDVMQESYAEAFLAIDRFQPNGSFESWLSRIARNNLLDAIRFLNAGRREGTWQRVQGSEGDESWCSVLALLTDSGTTPSAHAQRQEQATQLNHALSGLPDAYRIVVELYDLEGHPAEKVAEQLECSVGAVFMRRARAHRMLRGILSPDSPDTP